MRRHRRDAIARPQALNRGGRQVPRRRAVWHLNVLALVVAILFAPRLQAAEGGIAAYAPGSFASFIDALAPKPGFAVFNYFAYYNGSADVSHSFPIAGQIGANVSATTYVDSPGAFWITPLHFLGGYYAVGVSIPITWNTVSAQVTGPAGGTLGHSDSANGLGDIEFWPIVMTWGALGGDLHVNFWGGIYAPTGDFQKNRLANQGLNYWTFEPGVIVSYLSQKNGLEGTTYIAYDFNTTNSATDYHSGQVFHIDATAAWHFIKLGQKGGVIGVGANGFYLQQTTGDSGSGARLGSFKEEQAGVGPAISYAAQFSKIGVAAVVKWLPQISTDNTLSGNFVWVKVGVTF
jgi:hypothetical protein